MKNTSARRFAAVLLGIALALPTGLFAAQKGEMMKEDMGKTMKEEKGKVMKDDKMKKETGKMMKDDMKMEGKPKKN